MPKINNAKLLEVLEMAFRVTIPREIKGSWWDGTLGYEKGWNDCTVLMKKNKKKFIEYIKQL